MRVKQGVLSCQPLVVNGVATATCHLHKPAEIVMEVSLSHTQVGGPFFGPQSTEKGQGTPGKSQTAGKGLKTF